MHYARKNRHEQGPQSVTNDDSHAPEMDMEGLKRRSTRGAALTFASQGLKFGISFGSQLVLAHLLSPAEFGLVAMAAPVMGFVGIFTDLGLSQATIQRPSISQAELSSLFWVNVILSLVLTTLLILLSPVAGWVYGEPRVGPIVAALASLLLLGGLTSQSFALMNRRLQFKALALMEIAAAIVGAGSGIGSALVGAGYWSLVIQQAGNSATMLALIWIVSKFRPSRPRFEKSVVSMLRFGGHLTAFNIVSYFSSYFDNFLVGVLMGPVSLGFFDRAFKLVLQPLGQITTPISRVAVPMLSRLANAEESYRKAYLRMLQLVLLVTAPGLVCASVMAHQVVRALLGPAWDGTAPILSWLSIAGIFAAYSGSTYWLFVSQSRAKAQMKCGFISSGAIIVTMFIGLPWGPVGIAASYALFAPIVHGIFVWEAGRTGPVSRRDILVASSPIVLAVTASAAFLAVAGPLMPFPPLADVILGAGASYGFTIAVLLCIPAGNRMIREILAMRSMLRRG
jgi:PST family polysaccharide transporter